MRLSIFSSFCILLACFTIAVSGRSPIKIFKGKKVAQTLGYHNGPIMSGPVNVYFIWYGKWQLASQQLLEHFVDNLSNTKWFNIEKLYTDKNHQAAAGPLHYASSVTDSYSQGTSLNSDKINKIVTDTLSKGLLPVDTHGIYVVLTSADVKVQGFCSSWCAYHSFVPYENQNIMFAFSSDATIHCPTGCMYDSVRTPNNLPGADALANHIGHEIVETLSDPMFNAWENPDKGNYEENADKCAWQFGKITMLPNGSIFNIVVGGKNYLLQLLWNPIKNKCAQSA